MFLYVHVFLISEPKQHRLMTCLLVRLPRTAIYSYKSTMSLSLAIFIRTLLAYFCVSSLSNFAIPP